MGDRKGHLNTAVFNDLCGVLIVKQDQLNVTTDAGERFHDALATDTADTSLFGETARQDPDSTPSHASIHHLLPLEHPTNRRCVRRVRR